MKNVTFLKSFDLFFAGDSAQFETAMADKLIAAGIAKEYDGVAEAPADAPKAGKKF